MTPLVEVDGVSHAYGAPGGRAFALTGLSFSIAPGEILGVIGPNSAGKTTLVRLLTRVLAPTAGTIRLDGAPLGSLPLVEVARRVAVVPQDLPPGLPFTVAQLVLMGRYAHAPRRLFEGDDDRAAAREAMREVGVLELAGEAVGRLSGGERQRAVLARAVAQRPRLLVLDEPTAHLDLRHQVACVALLRRLNRERGVSVLLVSHDLDMAAAVCDRLLLLAAGRMVRIGAPEAVLAAGLLEEVYGCPVSVGRSASGRPMVRVAWPAAAGIPPAVRG